MPARGLRAGVDGEGGGVEAASQQVEADLRMARAVPQVVVLVRVLLQVEQLAAGVSVVDGQLMIRDRRYMVARELDHPARSPGAMLRAS